MANPENRELQILDGKFVGCNRPCFTENASGRDWTLLTTTFRGLIAEDGQLITQPVPMCLYPSEGAPRVCVDASAALGIHFQAIVPKEDSTP